MNRLTAAPAETSLKLAFTSDTATQQSRRVQLYQPAENDSPVATFVPQNYETNYAYPLVVWLHGQDQNECDLPHVIRHVSTRNYLAVSPRGVVSTSRDQECYGWRDTPGAVERAAERTFDAIDQVKRAFNVNARRVFVAGVGIGGTLAVRLALANPGVFCGAATFDGPLPSGDAPLARVNEIRKLPILLAGSRESAGYPESRLCGDLRLLHSAGATVSVRQYPGSDDLTTAMLSDFDRWMMDIVCGAKPDA